MNTVPTDRAALVKLFESIDMKPAQNIYFSRPNKCCCLLTACTIRKMPNNEALDKIAKMLMSDDVDCRDFVEFFADALDMDISYCLGVTYGWDYSTTPPADVSDMDMYKIGWYDGRMAANHFNLN